MPQPATDMDLRDWTARLATAGVPSPASDVRWLASHVLGVPPAQLALVDGADQAQIEQIDELVRRRERREPLQHILGTAPFLDLELVVGPGVFVPRPETEVLAAHVIDWLSHHASAPPKVVDLCTGSGALALAIACHVPHAHVIGVDVSPAALHYARRNAAALAGRIAANSAKAQFVEADVTRSPRHPVEAADVVVANPPYIPTGAVPRDPEVRDFDPELALFGGPDGFTVVRPMLHLAAAVLRPGGLLAVEHGDEQGGLDGMPGEIRAAGGAFTQVADHVDLAGRPRFTCAVRR